MLEAKQKKLIPYELYAAKKQRNGDHLTNVINRKFKEKQANEDICAFETREFIKKQIN